MEIPYEHKIHDEKIAEWAPRAGLECPYSVVAGFGYALVKNVHGETVVDCMGNAALAETVAASLTLLGFRY
jgi:hypothetical protein